ncbi:PAS domain-containing sensor histidine kinase [Olivibacter domesticus]|uniref:histidine kinase n=1 Tax=Olivibacter domesticus TaxID=407022 RepID=A0A1H7KGH8_OLID1|nr:PAS domain-containing sensor histidine kinase [Olivibacter domesticus]SEK85596.1 PAS domain S-box-containing protein [Olivibacter domesticus]
MEKDAKRLEKYGQDEPADTIDIRMREDNEQEEIRRATLSAIVDSSDDAIISKTLDGRVLSWNKAAEKMFGYKEQDMLGRPIQVLVPPARLEEQLRMVEKISRGEHVHHFETVRVHANGTEIPVSLTISPLKNSQGEIIGASKIVRDITLQVQLNQQLEIYNNRLEALNKFKDDFLITASHELKTPLTVLKWYMQSMDLKKDEEHRKYMKKKAMQQIDKLYDLVGELLDVSKLENGKLLIKPTFFNLDKLLSECIHNIYMIFNSHEIIYENCCSETLVTADRIRIEQVIINLLTNSIKYSPQKSKITVVLKENSSSFIVMVKDRGKGIPVKYHKKIFTRFFRVPEHENHTSGMGVGLYVSCEIIKRHGGRMWLTCEDDIGCSFYFSIPKVL